MLLRVTCDRARLLDLVENLTLFSEREAGLVKIIGQNHQFLDVNNAIASMLVARKLGHGRGGVFWQTQGRASVSRWCLRAEGAAQGGGQLDVRGRDRSRETPDAATHA